MYFGGQNTTTNGGRERERERERERAPFVLSETKCFTIWFIYVEKIALIQKVSNVDREQKRQNIRKHTMIAKCCIRMSLLLSVYFKFILCFFSPSALVDVLRRG